MWRVEWLQSALDELTVIWTQADSALRKGITAASHQIDERLGDAPSQEGESREGRTRIAFYPPLAVIFEVDEGAKVVTVAHLQLFQPRKR